MPEKNNLVIVESPAKAKTIEKYLGRNYKVKASMGHLRDLPKSSLGVDLDTFEPKYISMRDKTQVIKDLKAEAKKADTVFLATDPDREGEAISWHLKELLSLPDDKAKRVTFNEITKNVTRGRSTRTSSMPSRHAGFWTELSAINFHRCSGIPLNMASLRGASNRWRSAWWSTGKMKSGLFRRKNTGILMPC